MSGQGPVQSITIEQQLAKLEPLDPAHPAEEKGITRFSGREVKVALIATLPFLLAGLLTLLTSLFLPLGLAFGLATAGYFVAGTIASAAIFCKTLADRKAKAMPADSVFPFITQAPLQNISGSSPSPSYPSQIYRTPAASREKQELPSFPLPNQKPHPTVASDQKPPLNQRSLPAQVDDLPDSQRSQANTNNNPQISRSAATTTRIPPHSDSLPEPVRSYFRDINQPAISHQAHIRSKKSIDTSDVKTDNSFEEAIANAILESLLQEIATSNFAKTADSISDEASLTGNSAFDLPSTSSQSERIFSADYNSPSTPDSNNQSESEDNDDATSDLSVNTITTSSVSLQGDNRQTIISDSVSLQARVINQLHDSDDLREWSHSSHSTDGQTDTLTSDTIANEWHPANQSQTSTEQQIDIHNLSQIDDDSFVLEEDIDNAARPVESSGPSPVLEKASVERQQYDISEDFGLPETFEEPLINDDRDEEKVSTDEELSAFSSGLPKKVVQTAPITQTSLSMAPLDDTASEAFRKAPLLSDVPLQEVTRKNSSARLSKPLTLQKQSVKKAISDTSEKEAEVAFLSTDTHTLSASDHQTGKRVPAYVSDSPTVVSEKPVTKSRTSNALVRAPERQVALIEHNINDLSHLADGKALYFNIQATDIGSRLQLHLTPNNPDQDSIRPPGYLLKIEEGLMSTATREHSSSALTVPVRTHRHLKVTILINRDNPSSSTAITINRQVTPEAFAMLDAQLHKSGTCDLTIDKNQLSALQLEKLFALEGASTVDEPDKITEIDATEHLLETTSDSDLFTSILGASTETSVEFFAYDSQPRQPEKAHSQSVFSKPEPVKVTDNTELPVSKQSMIYKGLPEDALPVSSHSMMANDKQVTIEELQPHEVEAIIHGGFGNLEEILSKSRPESMLLIPEVQHNEELFSLTDKSWELHTSSLSLRIVAPDRVVGRQWPHKLTAHVSIKPDSAEIKAFDNGQSTSIHSDEHKILASNVLDKTESSSHVSSNQEDPARVSTPIEKRLLSVEKAHISHTYKAPKGNVAEPAPILSDKTVLAQSPSLAHEQTLNVTAETASVSTNNGNILIVRKRAAYKSPGSNDIAPKKAKKDLSTFNENRAAETIQETPDHQLPDAINAIVTEQATTHSAPSDEMAASPRPTMALEQPLNITIETIDPAPEFELPEAMQTTVTELYESKQPVADVLPILTDPITDSGKPPVPVNQTQADEQADIYESKAAKVIESHTPTDDDRGEETPSSLIVSLANDDTYSLPESDLVSCVYTATEQSHSLPAFSENAHSHNRRAFSLDKLNYGHLSDTEYSSSDTSPLLSPTGSDFGLANQQTSVFTGADNAASNQLGTMTPHLLGPAVRKSKTSLDDKHKRVRGHASDPELTTQRKDRLSGATIPEEIVHHLPELIDHSSFGSFCIDAQEVSEPDAIDDCYMDDWEDLRPFAQELKPFKQELEDAINKPLVLLEYLAHQLAYNLDGKSQVELPGHTDGNQRYNVQKVKEVPSGLNAYILYPENSDTEKPVDLKLIFRGTNPRDASVMRDLEPSGAGFDTMEKAAKNITQQLHNILKHYQGRAVNLTITGHSLGGADAQNFFGHFLNPNVSDITNETLTDTPLLANIQKLVLFTKCSAGVPEITHSRVISALNRLNGQQEQKGIKTEIFHLKVEGDIVQATGDCHIGSNLEHEIADVSILQISPSNEASRVDRHTKKFFTDDANLAPIYWYKWVKNTTDEGMEDIRLSVRDTSRILRSYPIKVTQRAIHSAANYWFHPSEAMAETAVLNDSTIAEQPEESTPFTSIRAESDDISASHPASLVTHSSAETLKEDQKNNATIGTESKEASINNEGSAVHLEDIPPIKTMGQIYESDSDQISDAEHSPDPTISLPWGRKQKKSRLQKIIPRKLRKRLVDDLAITVAFDKSICYRLGLCANKETKRKDIQPYDRDNNIKIQFIRMMLDDEQSFVRACDPYNIIRDINAEIEEEAKANIDFRYAILAKAKVTDKSLRGEEFRDATRPVTERAYWNFIARCQHDHSDTLDEESESNKGAFKYSFQLIHKLACFNNEFGQIEHDFNQFLFKKELSADDQKRLTPLLERAGTLQKHAESYYQECEKFNLDQKTIENILSKAVGPDNQNRQCKKLQRIQEGILGKLNEKPKSDIPEVLQEINEADNEPVEPATSSAYLDLQPENYLLAENNTHDKGMDDVGTGVDDVISLAGDMSFDLSSDDPLLSEDENDPIKQPDYLTGEQKFVLMQHQDNTGLQHLSLTDADKLVISSADIPSATAMMGLYSDAQKALDGIHEQGKHRKGANDVIKDISRYMSTIQEYFPVDAFSLQTPPADAVREKMYSQLVELCARYLILTTHPKASSRRTNSGKEQLGISAEFLWQTQKAWKSASPDLINGQVGAMLAIGLMKPEQKTFVFEVCLNTQIISLEDIRRNIEQLKNKQDELSDRLKNTVSESNEQNELNKRLLDIQSKLTTFEAQYTDLRSKESSGMKNQKDFLDSCYPQLTYQLQTELSQGVEKYLRRYQKEYKKKPDKEIKKLKELSKSVIADSGPMLRRKAEEYANETSREKENKEKGIHWKMKVKNERLKTLNKAVALLIDAEILRQLCASDMDKACKVFSPDMIIRLFNDQELTFNERSLPHIDSLNFFQILAENEKVDLMAEKKREDVNHQVQKDIEREAFSCHLKTADNTQSAFTHNDYLQEKSQLKATAFDGESPNEADLVQKSSARVLEKLTTAFKGLLKEAGLEEGERMEHLITTMLAHSHQGAYALHQGISEVIQSKLSQVTDAYLPKASHIDEMGPPRLVFPEQPSRKSNATMEIAKDVKGNNILLLSKVFEWDINLHDRELSHIPDARRRLRIETVYEVGLIEDSVKVRSINTSEVQLLNG